MEIYKADNYLNRMIIHFTYKLVTHSRSYIGSAFTLSFIRDADPWYIIGFLNGTSNMIEHSNTTCATKPMDTLKTTADVISV